MTLNIIKAPIGLATVWTIKNKFNRLIDSTYDLWYFKFFLKEVFQSKLYA